MDLFGILRAGLLLWCAALVAACADKGAPEQATMPAARPAADRGTYQVIVQPGQSLDAIALAFNVAKREIIAANHLAAPYSLKAGTILQIPTGAAKAVAKAKPVPQPKPPIAIAATPSVKPVQTARVSTPPRSAKPKSSEPEIIPLD